MTTIKPINITDNRTPISRALPIIDWSERIMPKQQEVPSEETIRELYSPQEAVALGYTSSFLGRMVVFYCRYIVCYYCDRHNLDFKRHCRELRKLLGELEKNMVRSISIETDRWLNDFHWEFIKENKSGCIEQLKYAIMNDILRGNPDCEDRDVAYGVNAALLIIRELDANGNRVADETSEKMGLKRAKDKPTYTRDPILTLIMVLLLDMAETLRSKAIFSQPSFTGVKVITNKFIEKIQQKWKRQ